MKDISGKIINKTIILNPNESLSGVDFTQTQKPYPLSEADFIKLKSRTPLTLNVSISLAGVILGFGITNIFPKYISRFIGPQDKITQADLITFCVFFVLAIFLYLIGFFLPNDYKEVIRKIKIHFKNNPMKNAFVKVKNDC